MSKIIITIAHEMKEMLPPTIFFFVILHIVVIIRSLMTTGTGISFDTSLSATLAALILGKSVLVANLLPFINRFPEKPLVWNVAWKTLIYAIVALFVHYLERLYEFWKDTRSLVAAQHALLAHMDWPRFWAIQILLVTLILMYCVIAELSRVIGRERLRKMFFGPIPSTRL